jgi:hypothetical protein
MKPRAENGEEKKEVLVFNTKVVRQTICRIFGQQIYKEIR